MAVIEKQFEKGDLVTLKSGGPKMTVTDVKYDYVSTAWFTKSEELKEATFWHESIEATR